MPAKIYAKHARRHLKSDGELWIVANRFLNYPLLIAAKFWPDVQPKPINKALKCCLPALKRNLKEQ